jgi:hypothetical protein
MKEMISELDKAYIAGFLDGEGTISLRWYEGMQYNRHGNFRHVSHRLVDIQIVNTNLDVLRYIQSLYGGSIHSKKETRENHKPVFRWRISGPNNAYAFLQDIRPYLRVKKAHVALALRFCATANKGEVVPILRDIRVLNQRGPIKSAQLHLN